MAKGSNFFADLAGSYTGQLTVPGPGVPPAIISGQIVAQSQTLEDEVINAEIDLRMAEQYKKTFFDYARHRSPDCYKLISEKKVR